MHKNERDEVLGGLISHIFSENKSLRIPKYSIHKVLFKLKVELPEENSIKDFLPFYWYNYGPFSEVIESKIDELKQNGTLKEYYISEGRKLLGLENEVTSSNTNDLEEAKDLLYNIIRDVDFYNVGSFVDDIYRKYAPCNFMPLFKLDFLSLLEKYVELELLGRQILNRSMDSQNIKEMENLLYDCEAELPYDSFYKPFNNCFSSYVTSANTAFDYIKDNNDNSQYLGEQVLHTAKTAWFTFAKGIRISDIGHDEYYNSKLVYWDGQYEKSIIDFNIHVNNFNSNVLNEIRPSGLSVGTPSDASKRILSSIVSGYLG